MECKKLPWRDVRSSLPLHQGPKTQKECNLTSAMKVSSSLSTAAWGLLSCVLQLLPKRVNCFLNMRCGRSVGLPVLLLLSSCQVMSDSSQPHGLQDNKLPCPSPSPGVCESSCPLNRCCQPTISSSATPYSFCLQSFPASVSFPISQLSAPGS